MKTLTSVETLTSLRTLAAVLICFSIALAPTVMAEEETEDPGWVHNAEFSLVATDGNSDATTFGLKYDASREWEKSRYKIGVSALRAESEGDVTAENYTFGTRYERDLTEKIFWFVGGGWRRDEFAGLENRFLVEAGAGHTWMKSETSHFKTSYAVTGTREEVVGLINSETFFGVRFSWDLLKQLTPSTTYTNILILDENLDETDDFRVDLEQSLAVSISKRLALKASLKLLYDNLPANPGLDDLDSIFKTALVVTF